MQTMRFLIIASVLALVAGTGAYLVADKAITHARAQGAAEVDASVAVTMDAAPSSGEEGQGTVTIKPDEKVTEALKTLPDPGKEPVKAVSTIRQFWDYGVWQGCALAAYLLAFLIASKTTPADRDGDGKPDPEGWRGKTWAISGAAVMALGPVVAMAVPGSEVTANALSFGVVCAVALLLTNLNPKKRAT